MLGKKPKVLVKVRRKVKAPFGKGCLNKSLHSDQNDKDGFQTTDLGRGRVRAKSESQEYILLNNLPYSERKNMPVLSHLHRKNIYREIPVSSCF